MQRSTRDLVTREEAETATRAELQAYLEGRGFAVHEKEHTEELRIAVMLDIDEPEPSPVEGATERQKKAQRRKEARALQRRGFLRVETYLGNMARMNDIPVERGPGMDWQNTDEQCDWVPAWFEWHIQRFKKGALQHISQRERIEQAKVLQEEPEEQFLLLTEAQLADGTLYDPEGDISTEEALKTLRKELGKSSTSPDD